MKKGRLLTCPANGQIIVETDNDGSISVYAVEDHGRELLLSQELTNIKNAIGVWSNLKIKNRLDKIIKEIKE